MTGLFNLLAIPLGFVMRIIYNVVNDYFLAIFLFTLLVRLLMFPISLKTQKSTADRARLAPRLERLQKKYGQDPRKLQEKQQELYEKEGISLTGGCLPLIVQFVVLFGVIAVIYQPLNYLAQVPTGVIETSVTAITRAEEEDPSVHPEKVDAKRLTGYYKELRLMEALDGNRDDILAALEAKGYKSEDAQAYYDDMSEMRQNFSVFGVSLLKQPWDGEDSAKGFGWLWLIPLLSGLTSFLSTWISMQYSKGGNPSQQPGQGCSNNVMTIGMPLFSLIIAFTVPGGVGVYWICSNIIALGQTVVLNHIYNPAEIRAQAEKDYEERRKRKAEDKKRLAEARAQEEAREKEIPSDNKTPSPSGD